MGGGSVLSQDVHLNLTDLFNKPFTHTHGERKRGEFNNVRKPQIFGPEGVKGSRRKNGKNGDTDRAEEDVNRSERERET